MEKTLENHIIMCWKEKEKVKLLQKRVDALYLIIIVFLILEICKLLF